MPASTFDQFRRFSTDAYGLERILRFTQAAVQILISLIAARNQVILSLVAASTDRLQLQNALASLRGQLGLVRRFFRMFRFLDAFTNSYKIYLTMLVSSQERESKSAGSLFLLQTLDAMAAGFNGGYLALETITLVDALGVPGLQIWGPRRELVLKIESQRCWFLALVAGAAACLVRLFQVNSRLAERRAQMSQLKRSRNGEQDSDGLDTTPEDVKEPESMVASVRAEMLQLDKENLRLFRKAAASILDLALPGSAIGWLPVAPGTLGGIMLVTSFLTGLDVWERCGREIS